MTRTSKIAWLGLMVLLAVAALLFFSHNQTDKAKLPVEVVFSADGSDGWRAYGGSWERTGSIVTNRSDERGAKLIGGSASWSDYELDLDLQVLGAFGDAGALVRVSDAEEGVDSYDGYYVGLRSANNTLVIGRANHMWREFSIARMQPALVVGRWYHLAIGAYACDIVAAATDEASNVTTRVAIHDPDCPLKGKVGLRSYASGGSWKALRVSPLTEPRFRELLHDTPLARPESFRHTEANFNSAVESDLIIDNLATMSNARGHALPLTTTNLGDIDFSMFGLASTPEVLVHGVVTFSGTDISIQDSTGAALLRGSTDRQIRIGDELAVQGSPKVDILGVTFVKPSVRILRSREPISPTFVTAAEASRGTYNNRFIQVEGQVLSEPRHTQSELEFSLGSNGQVFAAVLAEAASKSSIPGVRPNAHVRLTGIARSDDRFNREFYPFAVLLRSSEDVVVTAAPPWWGWRHILELALSLVCCLLLCGFAYSRILRWRYQAVTEERSRMAREIHDTLAQSFAAIAFQLESSLGQSDEPRFAPEPLAVALQMAKQSRKDAHVTIATLRSMQTESTLLPMLDAVLRPLCAMASITLLLEGDTQYAPPAEVGHQILRIAQEAVSNAVRHSFCTQVALRLQHQAGTLQMTITDNGHGFEHNPDLQQPLSEHFGLTGMKERARSIGGSLSIETNSSGTTISLNAVADVRTNRFTVLRAALARFRTMVGKRSERSI